MKISELAFEKRPRERLVAEGAAALEDAELIAILLRVGTAGRNVLDVARDLLSAAGGTVSSLERMPLLEMCAVAGIGKDKAVSIKAAMELSRRMSLEQSRAMKCVVDSPEDAARYLATLFSDGQREECWAMFLRRSRMVITSARISQGGISMTDIDTAGIVRRAVDLGAGSVIISHNHPSGNPEPSAADVALTERLRLALATFNINLTDHIILSDRGFYSFSDETVRRHAF